MNGWRERTLLARLKKDIRGRAVAAHAARRKAAAEAWVAQAVAGDAALGRGAGNWAGDPVAAMKPALPGLKARGVAAYFGGGQLLLVDLKPTDPVVLQRRPLAQREVVIRFTE